MFTNKPEASDKPALRARFRAERAAVSPEENHRISQQIMQRVIDCPLFQYAATVFLYVSTAREIETWKLLDYALAQGKWVCVPRCEPVSVGPRSMTARLIRSLDELIPGAYGIFEPPRYAPVIPLERIDMVLAPALACDRHGTRLGYGGGYYDRFLAAFRPRLPVFGYTRDLTSEKTPVARMAICAALCPESRLVDALPSEPYDVPCSLIFTERRVLRTDET